jgi:hypothetical protein
VWRVSENYFIIIIGGKQSGRAAPNESLAHLADGHLRKKEYGKRLKRFSINRGYSVFQMGEYVIPRSEATRNLPV